MIAFGKLTVFLVLILLHRTFAFPHSAPKRVVVVGASSSVGYLTFKKLLKRPQFDPIGVVRDNKGYKELHKLGIRDDQIRICDITDRGCLKGVFDTAQQVVICTSAVPRKKLGYKVTNFFRSLVGRSEALSADAFYYGKGQRPYEVDYIGQRNIIDACVKAKVGHIVLLGNMGGKFYLSSKLTRNILHTYGNLLPPYFRLPRDQIE